MARKMSASDIGAQNQERGQQTEKVMDGYHIAARQLGVADLFKVPTPTTIGEGGKIIFTKKSKTDFVGFTLDGTARHVAEEVKSHMEPGDFKMHKVEPHQRAYLEKVHAAGGIAVLTIVDRLWQVYVLEWDNIKTRTSLSYDDLRPRLVRPQMYLKRFLEPTARSVA
jgi:penicillin-binding protein-related factor A (putative recombinase)